VSELSSTPKDPFAALRIKDFTVFLSARFFLSLGVQIQSVVVAIQIYKLTHDPYMIGMIGLAEAIPFIGLSLFGGQVADSVRRKKILLWSTLFLLVASWGLFSIAYDAELLKQSGTWPIFAIIFCTGIARGFLSPVFPAYVAQLVPRTLYANAATWQSNSWHTTAVLGPALGGMLLGWISTEFAYGTSSALITLSFFLMFFITDHPLPMKEASQETIFKKLTAGVRFVFSNQIMLSALTLDLFAVLFGGAVAMIPVFAAEILKAGDDVDFVTGLLRSAPAAGAIIMGLFLAKFPPTRRAGRNLIVAVIGFGLCMIVFALSRNVWLSFGILLLSGMFDNVSVIIRHTILQLMPPDDMRGRVAAVNGVFIGSSNEIGEFESGVAARTMGNVPSVIFGGCMTIVVVGTVAILAPKLRKLNLDKLV
jgi:MFS family permease